MRESAKALKKIVGTELIKGIEVGVMQGANAMELYKNFRFARLYLVDGWQKRYTDNYIDNLSKTAALFDGYIKNVIIIKALSPNISDLFVDNTLNYIYLDGNHSPDHVYEEMVAFMPKLKKGGMLAGHDWNDAAPERVKKGVIRYCGEFGYRYSHAMNENEKVGDWWVIK